MWGKLITLEKLLRAFCGAYFGTAIAGMGITPNAWRMLVRGLLVLVHGVVFLAPAAAQLGTVSSPLMIGNTILVLLNQTWTTARIGSKCVGDER